MPETPDFNHIAFFVAANADRYQRINLQASIAEQLRLVWNTRPVPRCDRCRFWQQTQSDALAGDCRVFSDDPNIAEHHRWPAMTLPEQKAHVVPFAGANGGGLITDADFGCVQWEAKP
jgi:hypothetical protein